MNKIVSILLLLTGGFAQSQPDSLFVQWDKQVQVSKSTATLQVVVNPALRRGHSIHDQSFEALKNLGCDYVRYVPWLPYPKLGVAELEPPSGKKTFWNFALIDPMTLDFMEATKGHPIIMNFSTIPAWMYKTSSRIRYPDNPDSVFWNYTQGAEPTDSSLSQIADYYARLYSWYTKAGFTDEAGVYHKSGYHFNIPYWEVLNEPDLEHQPSPELYTRIYDAVVEAIKKISPETKFVGLGLSSESNPHWFEYFLDPKNHKQGIPLDMISYHFYAIGEPEQHSDIMQYSFFDRADGFINTVRYIENIRKRLSPSTKTTINEIGSILMSDFSKTNSSIPHEYWNLSGALYAYLYVGLTHIGIDIIGESQLVGYPSQFPSVSMMNWENGKPNSRYWVLKLIRDNFSASDTLVESRIDSDNDILAQGFRTKSGKKVLLINKRNEVRKFFLPAAFRGSQLTVVDPSTGDEEPKRIPVTDNAVELQPFAVAVLSN